MIVQVPPFAGTEAPHVLVWAKSPLAVMLPMFSMALPEFVSVTGCDALVVLTDWFGKVRLVVETLTAGASPVKPAVCGLPRPLSVTAREALKFPSAAGVNFT